MPHYRPDPLRLRDAVRETLAGAGISEAVTLALVSPAMVERFGPAGDVTVAGEGEPDGLPIVVSNPLSSQHSVMRQSVIGSLLEVLEGNVRQGQVDVALFEIGKGYGRLEGDRTHEWWRLAFVLTGTAEPASWNRAARPYDLDDAKGLIELLAHRLALPEVTYEARRDDPNLHPGRAATAVAGEGLRGRVGELHPRLHEALETRADRIVVAELAIAGLSGGAPAVPLGATPSRFPAVERDLAVVVPESTPAGDVAASIRRHGGEALERVALFDVYRGRPLADDERSLAYRLTFGARDTALGDALVDAAVAAITAGLASDVGARIRT